MFQGSVSNQGKFGGHSTKCPEERQKWHSVNYKMCEKE